MIKYSELEVGFYWTGLVELKLMKYTAKFLQKKENKRRNWTENEVLASSLEYKDVTDGTSIWNCNNLITILTYRVKSLNKD